MINKVHVMTFLVVLVLAALAQAQIYDFDDGTDGGNPEAGVIQDPSGNLYGTTVLGGVSCTNPFGCGVVYKLDTSGNETVLYSFTGRSDGGFPVGSVARDKAGNIYGTTIGGGSADYGTVFKIDTAGNETVLYSFTGGSDGCNPTQGLVVGKSGDLYGTTYGCGAYYYGTIFRVDSAGNFSLLHGFTGGSSDGADPSYGHLTMDRSGNLYGVTEWGGANAWGALYKLSKNRTLALLRSFKGGHNDGCQPFGSVVQDRAGNFYGTTSGCGSDGYGTIWKVSKKGKETILHNFAGSPSDGCDPVAGVARDSEGNLYGVASLCGASGDGALYELSARGRFILLHSFDYWDGAGPIGEVLRTTKGTLFGTAEQGGTYEWGAVWSY